MHLARLRGLRLSSGSCQNLVTHGVARYGRFALAPMAALVARHSWSVAPAWGAPAADVPSSTARLKFIPGREREIGHGHGHGHVETEIGVGLGRCT